MKKCASCHIEKPEDAFSKDKNRKDGLQKSCKLCNKKYVQDHSETIKNKRKEYYKLNTNKILSKNEEYYIENQDKIKNRRKQHYNENRKSLLQKSKSYYKDNIDKFSKYKKAYNAINAEKISIKRKSAYIANVNKILEIRKDYYCVKKEQILKQHYQYVKNKTANYPVFALIRRVRTLILCALRKKSYRKTSRTYEILGCSPEQFKVHIEKQFVDGMSWNNRNKWHLDHYYPLASASTEEDIIRLNHYTNLRPLWASDNIKKGSKIPC